METEISIVYLKNSYFKYESVSLIPSGRLAF